MRFQHIITKPEKIGLFGIKQGYLQAANLQVFKNQDIQIYMHLTTAYFCFGVCPDSNINFKNLHEVKIVLFRLSRSQVQLQNYILIITSKFVLLNRHTSGLQEYKLLVFMVTAPQLQYASHNSKVTEILITQSQLQISNKKQQQTKSQFHNS